MLGNPIRPKEPSTIPGPATRPTPEPRPGKGDPWFPLGCRRPIPVGRTSIRTVEVARRFGVPIVPRSVTIAGDVDIRLGPGRIILLLGPSGSGKTSALECLQSQISTACRVGRIAFPAETAVIDRVAPGAPLAEAVECLTAAGLGDAHLWVRPFTALSEGEQFRARLACALGLGRRFGGCAPLLCDEFCSTLHRPAAKAISFNLRKLVTRHGYCAVLAVGNEDLLADLQPDTVIHLSRAGAPKVQERSVRESRRFSLRRALAIEPGRKGDYDAFAAMHYRAADELGFVDKIYVLRARAGGEPLGIVVYSHPPLELALRNRATEGRFSRDPAALNRHVRILRRLVLHPDVRGCGLGHWLVRRTMPLLGTEYVECLASMGEFNPVFEKAGMRRIGQCELPPACRRAWEDLRALGVDPLARDFTTQALRQPRIRDIVSRVVADWYAATTGGGKARVPRQSPEFLARTFRGLIASRPVYYLWRRRRRRTQTSTAGGVGKAA